MFPALRPPAEVGMSVQQVDTPALLLDLDAFERNLAAMARRASAAGVRLRPHAKTHKCPAVALRQMAHGAVGVCCQKVGEAEAMVLGGIGNVLVTNEIVGAAKLRRLAGLARQAWIGVCVDAADNIGELNEAALGAQARLNVLVEIDVGARRCGVDSADAALALARAVAAAPGLHFAGLQAYQGRAQHLRSIEERRSAIDAAVAFTGATVALLERNGLACDIVGGAGTGTFELEAASGVYNELQTGSYVFMDADYARNRSADGHPFNDFEHSLTLLSTIMSARPPDHFVIDAGLKAHASDCGPATVVDLPGAQYTRPSDDHAVVAMEGDATRPRLGDKLQLIPGHCDPTVNLHDWLVGVRAGRVECLWPVTARGATR